MVGGLVENEQVVLGDEQPGQRHPAPLTAGQAAGERVQVEAVEQPGEDLADPASPAHSCSGLSPRTRSCTDRAVVEVVALAQRPTCRPRPWVTRPVFGLRSARRALRSGLSCRRRCGRPRRSARPPPMPRETASSSGLGPYALETDSRLIRFTRRQARRRGSGSGRSHHGRRPGRGHRRGATERHTPTPPMASGQIERMGLGARRGTRRSGRNRRPVRRARPSPGPAPACASATAQHQRRGLQVVAQRPAERLGVAGGERRHQLVGGPWPAALLAEGGAQPIALGIDLRGGQAAVGEREDPVEPASGRRRRQPLPRPRPRAVPPISAKGRRCREPRRAP